MAKEESKEESKEVSGLVIEQKQLMLLAISLTMFTIGLLFMNLLLKQFKTTVMLFFYVIVVIGITSIVMNM